MDDEQNESPMASVFRMDQQVAADEAASRDQIAWDLHVRAQQSQIDAQEALAKRLRAWAGLIETAAFGFGAAIAFLVAAVGVWAIQQIIGWF